MLHDGKNIGGLAAVAIAFLFLCKLIEQRHRFWRMAGQFALFGAVCIPLGLWWQVYNFIRYGMPLSYVPLLSLKEAQYIGEYTLWQRLFDWSPHQLERVFVAFGERSLVNYHEYNVLLGLLKTSVFGEFFLFQPDTLGNTLSVILFYTNAALVAFSLFAMVWAFCRKSTLHWQLRVFFWSAVSDRAWLLRYVLHAVSPHLYPKYPLRCGHRLCGIDRHRLTLEGLAV